MSGMQRGYQYPSVPKNSQSPPRPRLSINTRQAHHLSYIQTPVHESTGAQIHQSADQNPGPTSAIPAVPLIPSDFKYANQALSQLHHPVHQEVEKLRSPSPIQTPATAATSSFSDHKYDLTVPQGLSELPPHCHQAPPPTALPDRTYQWKSPVTPIQPDENPLSPTTSFPRLPNNHYISRSNTTNMSIIPPPSNHPIHTPSYTPSAPTPPTKIVGGSWTHSLFSLTAPVLSLKTCVCPGITYSQTNFRLKSKSERKDPTNMLGFHSINSTCIVWTLLCPVGLGGVLTALQKRRVRKAYQMNEDQSSHGTCGDCLEGCCCCYCGLVRNEREVRGREEMARGGDHVGNKGVEKAYKSPSTMTYSSLSTRSTFGSATITK